MQRLLDWLQRLIEVCFYGLFFITPFIFNPANSELFEMPKMNFIWAITTIIVGAWLAKSVLAGSLVFRRTILDLPLLLFLLSQIASTYFSIDPHTSFFGYYSRINGGLFSLAAYSLLYWAYVANMSSENTLKAVRCLLLAASLVAIWAILEHFGFSPSCLLLKGELNANCWVQDVQNRVFATLGQPNWLAAWLVAIVPLSWSLVTSDKLKVTSFKTLDLVTCYVLPVTLLFATIFTKSRSGFLGLATAVATFIFFHLPNKLLLRLGYLLLIAISGFFLLAYNLSDCFDLNPNQLTSAAGTESCKIRTIVWKGALDIWKNNPLLGTGPETFAYSYYNYRPVEHNLTSEWELLYNKAHNEYLNFLANTGLVGLTTYLFLIASTIFVLTKNTNGSRKTRIVFLSGYVSILVTNFFGFSISVVNLLFFLYPAMALTVIGNKAKVTSYNKIDIKRIVLLTLTIALTCYLLLVTYNFYRADTLYAKADKYGKQGQYPQAAKKIKDALFLRGDEPLYYNELAEQSSFLATDTYEAQDASTSAKLAQLALDSSSLATSISPYNLNFLKNQSLVFARLALIDPIYISRAIPPLEKATVLAPTDPKVHYNLGVLYQRAGEKDKARDMIKKALELKPDYQDAILALQELQSK